jgi:hypothetical protein
VTFGELDLHDRQAQPGAIVEPVGYLSREVAELVHRHLENLVAHGQARRRRKTAAFGIARAGTCGRRSEDEE